LELETIPARLVPADDAALAELVENLDRKELSAVERAEMTARAAEMLRERQKRDGRWTKLGGVLGRPGPKPQGGRPEDGVRLAARILKTSRANVRRAERFRKLDPEAKAFLRNSVKLRNSSEAIDSTAKIPSGEQIAFLQRLEQAARLQDVTREPQTVERYENERGDWEQLTYALFPGAPHKPAPVEIMSPSRRKPAGLSLTDRVYEVMDDYGTEGAAALFEVAVQNLAWAFLTGSAKGIIDAEIERRANTHG
jgi:hypothetical protein